jgi:hypothetical protein
MLMPNMADFRQRARNHFVDSPTRRPPPAFPRRHGGGASSDVRPTSVLYCQRQLDRHRPPACDRSARVRHVCYCAAPPHHRYRVTVGNRIRTVVFCVTALVLPVRWRLKPQHYPQPFQHVITQYRRDLRRDASLAAILLGITAIAWTAVALAARMAVVVVAVPVGWDCATACRLRVSKSGTHLLYAALS